MAYPNFKFPGVELTQEFVETPVTGVSALGVAVIGQKYVIADKNTDNPVVTLDTAYATGTATTVNATDMPVALAQALSGAADDTTFTKSIIIEEGEIYRQDAAITGVTGSSDPSIYRQFEFPQFLTDSIGQVGDKIYITPVVEGEAGTTVSGTVTDIEGKFVSVTMDTAVGGATQYKAQFSTTEGGKIVLDTTNSGSSINVGTTPTIVIGANAKAFIDLGAEYATTATLVKSITKFSCWYRLKPAVTKYALGVAASFTEVVEQLGYPSKDNPLAMAVTAALSSSNGNVVSYVATLSTVTDMVSKYTGAFDFLGKNAEIYSIVPDVEAKTDPATSFNVNNQIIRSLLSQVVSTSEDKESKIRRTLWFGIENPTVADREDLIPTILAGKLNISSYRAQAVWADDALYNGEVIPNSAIAAAAAGMRAGQPVHRPISNLGYSFFSIKEKYGLTKTELAQLGANGIWIVSPNFDGTPINMRQVTTDSSGSLMKFEESIISNVDSIALSLCHLGETLVGCSNISPALITALTDGITTIMTSKTRNTTGSDLIGPQLLGWSLDSIYQDQVLRDHVYATITCEPPRPFNRFVMTLRVV